MYSCFEAFFANRAFPCFDQPDLKASLSLITVTPEKWVVVSNEYEELTDFNKGSIAGRLKELDFPDFLIKNIPEPYALRRFRKTEVISTYLYAFIAGSYKEFKRKQEEGLPPMRILVRKSLEKYMVHHYDEVFAYTSNGIKFFREFFGSPFPYRKYDTIFVPDFKFRAMEHLGAVIINEEFLAKDIMTQLDKHALADIVLHQASHMWFGNLVTMKWWNDLWLNESFAVFMATLALDKAKGFESFHLSAWRVFHKNVAVAIKEDQERTTHPVTTCVVTTEEAENLFDSITYWKGASVLKQLYYFLGADVFQIGVKEYFSRYKGMNTELKDFISCMRTALKIQKEEADLNYWVDLWLTKKGVNELRPEIKYKNGVITEFNIVQTSAINGDNVYRMHRLDIALFDEGFGESIIQSAYIAPQPICSIKSLVGRPKPHAVLLNVNDNAYAKIHLDDDSLAAFQEHMMMISNDLTKLIIWQSVWDMVRDGISPVSNFLTFVHKQVEVENEPLIFSLALDYTLNAIKAFLPDQLKIQEASKIFDMIVAKIHSEKGVDNKRHLMKYVTEFAYTTKQRELLQSWLQKSGEPGLQLSQQNRYAIIKLIFREKDKSLEEKENLLKSEREKDKSNEGLRAELACHASLPDPAVKQKLWNWYKDENATETESLLFASMSSFWCWEQAEIMDKYINEFCEAVKEL